jgi:hypothetical protein
MRYASSGGAVVLCFVRSSGVSVLNALLYAGIYARAALPCWPLLLPLFFFFFRRYTPLFRSPLNAAAIPRAAVSQSLSDAAATLTIVSFHVAATAAG